MVHPMFRGRLTQAIVHLLDRIAPPSAPPEDEPEHLRTGRRGEEDAYFYLRRRGYTMIARNYRSPHHRGEIDLVGWEGDVLCFIEVKTRTTRAVKPAEAAVGRDKRQELRRMAHDFLRQMPSRLQRRTDSGRNMLIARENVQSRFDVVSVYYDRGFGHPTFELFQNAFSVAYNKRFAHSY